MPVDGSIIIDTRIDTKSAKADLQLLQAKAKSTARQIGALDKQLGQATSKRSKLADDLAAAKQQAEATAKALDEVNAKLDTARAANLAAVQKEFPGMSAANAASIAESRTLGQYGADFARSDKLAADYAKQEAAISRLTEEYEQQGRAVERLKQQKQGLVLQFDSEQKAVDKATAAYERQQKTQKTTPAVSAPAQITAASKAMQRFGSRMREIVSGALLFNIISTGLSGLVRWMGTALQSTDAFGSALRNLQGAASVAAAPLIDVLGNALAYVIDLLATGMSYLARFISMLTGKSLSAMKSSAKAMNRYGAAAGSAAKETDKAASSLAGFDEITRLDAPQQEADGGGAGGAAGPNYDFVDQTGAGFTNLLDTVKGFWDQFTAALAPSIAAWGAAWEQIKTTAMAVWPQIQAAAGSLWQNAIDPLLGYLAGTWAPGMVNAFSAAFAPIIGGAVSVGIQAFADFFVWACGIATDAVNNLLLPILETILVVWQGIMSGIQAAWAEYGQPLMDGVVAAFRNVEALFSNLYYTVIEPIVANLIALLQSLWNEHLQKLWNDVVAMAAAMGNAVLTLWNDVLSPAVNWVVSFFGPTFRDAFNAVAGAVSTAVGFMSDALDILVTVLRGVMDFLTAVFQGNWGAAWNAIADTVGSVWDRIQSMVKSGVNGLIGFVNGMIQAVVNALNRVGSLLNSFSFTIPDWVPGIGGNTLGFHFGTVTAPQIPYLAQGAVIPPNREFLAVLGDQSHGTNVEAPLVTIQQAVASVVQDMMDGSIAATEQNTAVLRQILEAVLGIRIGDDAIGSAVSRYTTRQAIITGRA